MANLHQMIMGQAFQNALGSAANEQASMQQLAQYASKVAIDNIEKQKAAKIAERQRDAQSDAALKQYDAFNTNSGVLKDLQPSLKLNKEGNFEFTASTISKGERSTIAKNEAELRRGKEQENIIKQFNSPDSKLTVTDLVNAGIKPTDAEKMEELRVPVMQARQALQQEYLNMQQSIKQTVIPQTNTGIPNRVSNVVTPKYGPSGRSEGSVDINAQSQIDTAAAEVQVAKEVKSQQKKAGELAERGVQRASGTTNTAMDEVFRFNKENFENFGVKPGQAFGWIERLQPQQTNKYKAAATGAGREAAATVGTQIIPAARAVRMVDIFAKSTAEIGNTVEGNAANVAASMGNVWGTALSTNFDVELNDGSKVPIKTLVKDPLTGKPLSEIQYPDILMAIGRATEEFKIKTEQYYLNKAFDQYPEILQDSTKEQITSQRRRARIAELRSKM